MRPVVPMLLVAGCVPAPLQISLPDLSAETVTYVAATPEGVVRGAYVASRAAGSLDGFSALPRREGEALRLQAQPSGCGLDVLGLQPGLQALEGEVHRAPASPWTLAAQWDDEGVSEWAPEDPLPLLLPRKARCPRFSRAAADVPIRSGEYLSLLLPGQDPAEVIVALNTGRFFRVAGTQAEPLPISGVPTLAAHVEPGGRVWLFGGGRLASGDLDAGFSLRPEVLAEGTGSIGAFLVGPRGPAALELFALGDDPRTTTDSITVRLARFDGVSWSTLATGTVQRAEELAGAGLAWVGPGEIYAVAPWRSGLLHWRDGQLSWEVLPSGAEPTTVVWVEGWGPVVGTIDGQVLVRQEGSWVSPGTSPLRGLRRFVTAIAGLGGGFLFGGGLGTFDQYEPGLEGAPFCDYANNPPADGLLSGDLLAPSWVPRTLRTRCGVVLISSGEHAAQVLFYDQLPPL